MALSFSFALFNSDGLFALAKNVGFALAFLVVTYLIWLTASVLKGVVDVLGGFGQKLSDLKSEVDKLVSLDGKVDKMESGINEKFDKLEASINTNIDTNFEKFLENQIALNNRMSYVEGFSGVSRFNRRV